jgi:hypothetical protein
MVTWHMVKEKKFEEAVVIKDFLKNYKSISSKHTYQYLLKRYFEFIGEDPDEYIKMKKDYRDDIKKYAQHNQYHPLNNLY